LTVPRPLKPIAIALVILGISAAHYATDPARIWWHIAYQELCYAPILVSAYWFGVPGGLTTAVVAGLGTSVHFYRQWNGNTPFVVSEYGQAVGFVIAGAVGGLLAAAERRAAARHQQALSELERAHAELKTSHDQLLRVDRLSRLGEIAAGLAHEVGNPLAGVKGALEIVTSRAKPGTPEAEFSALATREIARLDALIAEFLRFARPPEPRRTDVDIIDVLDRVTALIGREAADRGVSIHVTRTSTPRVSVDSDQMVQVFVNIVLNAVQVSPSGSRVEIGALVSDGMLAVSVRDEGPGIRPEHLDRIFDPFFSTKTRGTGLGLSISNRIVQSHGGRIEVQQPGRGTVIRVLLPLQSTNRTVPSQKPARQQHERP
jgi:signal transduction histidine kinase